MLDQFNFKAFEDDILDVVQIMICVSDRVENIVGKGENAGYQHFLLFPQCFQRVSLSGSLKVGIGGKELIEQEKMMVTFSLFHYFKEKLQNLSYTEIVHCNCFHFGQG